MIDEDLNVATIRCFSQNDQGTPCPVRVDGAVGRNDNPLVERLRDEIDPDHDPWRALSEAAAAAARDRRDQLESRLAAAVAAMEHSDGKRPHPRRFHLGRKAAAAGAPTTHPLGARDGPTVQATRRPRSSLRRRGGGLGLRRQYRRLPPQSGRTQGRRPRRGRELHPGEYPSTIDAARRYMQVSAGDNQIGDARDLFWVHTGGNINVLSGCGLGGTSLINANVALRADPRVFEDACWPRSLQNDQVGIEAAYARAEQMLSPAPYPSSFPPLAKMEALRQAADGQTWYPTPINVTFRSGPNAAGVHQEACTGCGDCVTGCNYGAKNTLLMNYLPDAVAHGAHIFTEVDVRWLERGNAASDSTEPKWVVRVQPLGGGRDLLEAPPLTITADIVVVAAGTLGSFRVLQESRQRGLPLSDRLGHRFTGNGDVLGFAHRRRPRVDGIGSGHHPPNAKHPAGPCITSVIDQRAGQTLTEGIIIEDAVVPGAVAGLLPIELVGQAGRHWLRGRLPGGGPVSALLSVFSGGRLGMTRRLQTFLVMGHDDQHGTVVMDGDQVRVESPDAGTGGCCHGQRSSRRRLVLGSVRSCATRCGRRFSTATW